MWPRYDMLERTAVFGRGHGATKFELIFPSEASPPLPPLSYAALTYGMSATPCGQRRVIRIYSSPNKFFLLKQDVASMNHIRFLLF